MCDLNPLDYGTWNVLESTVWRNQVKTVDELKDMIVRCWNKFPQDQIDKVIASFRARLKKVIEVEGEHIERFL